MARTQQDTVEERRARALKMLRDLPPLELKGVKTFELVVARDKTTGRKVKINRKILAEQRDRYTPLKMKKRSTLTAKEPEEDLLSEDEMGALSVSALRTLPEYKNLKKSVRESLTSKDRIITAILGRRNKRLRSR